MGDNPDFIVVGGGSGGAAAAARLSESSGDKVLLLEGGGESDRMLSNMPAGFARMLGDPTFDWGYMQEPDASIGGRRFMWSGGKMLGGGSAINGLVYIRGSVHDHEIWVQSGCPGWSFADCLPFFLRAEHYNGPVDSPVHGRNGVLNVSPMRSPHPLTHVFMEGCAQSGLPNLNEYCDGGMDGSFLTLTTQENGVRSSTARSFLREARQRPNLEVRTHAVAERLIFDGTRAVGVQYKRDGKMEEVRASKEIIVCCGTVGSSALLMRSGVGDAAALSKLGINVVANRPGVGANLQEHPSVGCNKFVNQPTYNSKMGPIDLALQMAQYQLFKTGPMSTPAVQAMALARTRPGLEDPDIQLHFYPVAMDYGPETTSAGKRTMPKEAAVTIGATICRPQSRGRILLRGPSSDQPPIIDHQLIGDQRDVDTLIAGCRLIDKIFAADAWKRVGARHRSPDNPQGDDKIYEEHVRTHAGIAYHPVGTCRMGADADAVVTPRLQVNGVQNLRVADASIMPHVISVNTNATSIMIGERAADFIKQDAR